MKYLIAFLVLVGCIPQPPEVAIVHIPPAEPHTPLPTPLSASFTKTWNAVIDVFATRSIPIRTIDRSSGIIVTEPLRVDSRDPATTWADCGVTKVKELEHKYGEVDNWRETGHTINIPTLASYNVLVRGDSIASTILVTATWSGSSMVCTTKGVWETDFTTTIRNAIK